MNDDAWWTPDANHQKQAAPASEFPYVKPIQLFSELFDLLFSDTFIQTVLHTHILSSSLGAFWQGVFLVQNRSLVGMRGKRCRPPRCWRSLLITPTNSRQPPSSYHTLYMILPFILHADWYASDTYSLMYTSPDEHISVH